jgi:hypothetical protein
MLKYTGLGLGMVLAGWLIYLFTTSEAFRQAVLIGGAFISGVVLVLVIVVVVMRTQAAALANLKQPTVNNNTKYPPLQFPAQYAQLPQGQGQGWQIPIEQDIVDGSSEVIG